MSVRSFPNHVVRTVCVALAAALTFAPGFRDTVSADTVTTTLSVTSDPVDAAVYVDGRLAGRTPIRLDSVSVGDHRVRVVKSGYLENRRVVGVRTGGSNALTVKLTRDDNPSAPASALAPGGGSKKWLWIGLGLAAVGGGVAALAGGGGGGGNQSPVVTGVTASASFGLMNATSINFSAAGASDPDGDTLSYSWDFGNGTTSTSATPSVVFTSTGVFTVRVTVSDGRASAASTTSVTIRSMTGTWRGSLFQGVFTLTQSGTSVTGTYNDEDGPGTLTAGSVSASAPNFRITISQPQFGFTATVTGNADGTISVFTGTISGGGVNAPYTLTRQ